MLAAYADIVGTLALIVSGISVYLYWRFRQTEPKQAVRVQKELARHQAETVFLPRFRLEVINALHFLDPPDGWLETSELVSNVHTRFGQLYRTWGEGQHLVSPEVSRAMRELDILGEVRWLEDLSYNTRSDEEIHGRLREVKPRYSECVRSSSGNYAEGLGRSTRTRGQLHRGYGCVSLTIHDSEITRCCRDFGMAEQFRHHGDRDTLPE